MQVVAILAGVVAVGAAVRSLPYIWRFVQQAAKVPGVLEAVANEFATNGGHSMRDAVDRVEVTLDNHMEHDTESFSSLERANGQLAVIQTTTSATLAQLGAYTHDRWHALDGRLSAIFGIVALLTDTRLEAEERSRMIDEIMEQAHKNVGTPSEGSHEHRREGD